MLRLEWNNPKITMSDLELFLSNYLSTNYDGLLLEGTKLDIITVDVITQEQETYIKDWFYSLNDMPISIKDSDKEIDSQGRQIIRAAAGQKGWTYLARPIEFEISKIGSLYSKNYLDQDYTDVTIKFYNASNVEVTSAENESTIVKTVVLLKPNHDYELIAGNVRQIVSPTNDIRVWVIGGIIELGGDYVKEFAAGINMKYLGADEEIKTDGRAAKYMTKDIVGVPYQANQLQVIVRHNAGDYHKIMLTFEYFRA